MRSTQVEPGAADATLVERARAGDRRAFDELARRYSRRLFGLVLRWTRDPDQAQDLTQEALVRAWRGLARFEGGQEFRSWLFRIALNLATDQARARRRHRSVPLSEMTEGELGEAPGERTEERLDREQLAGRLEAGLARLSPEHRAVLLLRAREEMSYDEIAATLGVPRGTVMSRLARARLQLRAWLEQERAEPTP